MPTTHEACSFHNIPLVETVSRRQLPNLLCLMGLLLCFLQQQYGFVRLGDSEGSFIVDAYPVSVHYSDVAIIFVTVIAVGWLAVWYPVRALSKRLLS